MRRDLMAGCLAALFGAVTMLQASSYRIGSLTSIGPGMFPFLAGAALFICGGAIAASYFLPQDTDSSAERMELPDVKAGIFIVLGLVSFILLGERAGLAVASFACVFISAMGAENITWRGSVMLALGLAAGSIVLFHYALKLPLPAFPWSPS